MERLKLTSLRNGFSSAGDLTGRERGSLEQPAKQLEISGEKSRQPDSYTRECNQANVHVACADGFARREQESACSQDENNGDASDEIG